MSQSVKITILLAIVAGNLASGPFGQQWPCQTNQVHVPKHLVGVELTGVFTMAGDWLAFFTNPDGMIIYQRDNSTVQWVFHQMIEQEKSIFSFDRYLDMTVDTLAIGGKAILEDGAIDHAVFIYRLDPFDELWILHQTLVRPENDIVNSFGRAISIGDDVIAIGDPLNRELDVGVGAVFVYEMDAERWEFSTKIVPDMPVFNGNFGHAVDIHGDRIVVGAPMRGAQVDIGAGLAFAFLRENDSWIPDVVMAPPDGDNRDRFGSMVKCDVDGVFVGAVQSSPVDDGKLYLFRFDGTLRQQFRPGTLHTRGFGSSVVVQDNDIYVSAPGNGEIYQCRIQSAVCPLAVERDCRVGASLGFLGGKLHAWGNPECDGRYSGAFLEFSLAGPDVDRDFRIDDCDNCPFVANEEQEDFDEDGFGDPCDDDFDGDGVVNSEDNCPTLSNADQRDHEGDGIGDICDSDDDNDGIRDREDNCPLDANPDQSDSDDTTLGDVCQPGHPVCQSRSVVLPYGVSHEGMTVAANENNGEEWLAIGAPKEQTFGNLAFGVVFLYKQVDDLWHPNALLILPASVVNSASASTSSNPSAHNTSLGTRIVFSQCGGHIFIQSGEPRIRSFVFSRVGGSWRYGRELTAFGNFESHDVGWSFAATELWALSSNPYVGAGVVHVYRQSQESWADHSHLIFPDDPDGRFGWSVDIREMLDGTTMAVVGAPGVNEKGAVYIFEGKSDQWLHVQTLAASDNIENDRFGYHVAIHNDFIAVTTITQKVYIFRPFGDRWKEQAILDTRPIGSVDVDCNRILIGHPNEYVSDLVGIGMATLYQFDGEQWQVEQLFATANAEDFAREVALTRRWAAITVPALWGTGSERRGIFTYSISDDLDNDRVWDACDNCTTASNSAQSDCDHNDIGDACITSSDFTGDGLVTLLDYAEFADCLAGAGLPPDHSTSSCNQPCLSAFDFDGDVDIDLHDFAVLQGVFHR